MRKPRAGLVFSARDLAENRKTRRLLPAAVFLLLLVSCGPKDTDSGPGGVSIGEARALDDAASMLDRQRLAPGALASGTPASGSPSPTSSPTPSPSHSPPG